MIPEADISIVIVSYNVRDFLARCLESVRQATAHLQAQVIVVDNASIDGSPQMVSSQFPEVTLIHNQKNVGFGVANNQGFQLSTGRYTLILNPDTLLGEETLLACQKTLDENASIGAVGVKMMDGSGKYLPESKRGLPGVWRSFTKLTGLYKLFPNSLFWNGYYLGSLNAGTNGDVEVLTGAFMFVRTSILHDLKGFDERFFMYGEDIDLSKRILDAGYRIYFLADEQIVHFKGESTQKAGFAYNKRFYESMVIYAEKHIGREGPWFLLFLKVATAILGVGSWLGHVVRSLAGPLVALGLTYTVYALSHHLWSRYYFADENYFDQHNVVWTSLICSVIIVFNTWFYGWFDRLPKAKYLHAGLISALLMILVVFAILPAELRNSRAVIFIGWLCAYPVLWAQYFIRGGMIRSQQKRTVVVTNDAANQKFESFNTTKENHIFLGYVAGTNNSKSGNYLNDIGHLSDIIRDLKVDEVIFDAGSLKMKDILQHMAMPSTEVSYKIAGSSSIVGSASGKSTGEIYRAEVSYRLAKPVYRRLKRLTDLLLALTAMITWSFIGSRIRKNFPFKSLIAIFSGGSTWISYSDENSRANLPPLKPGILNTSALIGRVIDGSFVDNMQNADICYVKDYDPTFDIQILIQNIKKK